MGKEESLSSEMWSDMGFTKILQESVKMVALNKGKRIKEKEVECGWQSKQLMGKFSSKALLAKWKKCILEII